MKNPQELSITFSAFFLLDTTIDLINYISQWQQTFTKMRRPKLKQTDFLTKIADTVDFISSSPVNRIYKFHIARGNIFLLPIPVGRNGRPVRASPKLANQLMRFASPSHEQLSKAYHVLRVCLPDQAMNSFMPLAEWVSNAWMPQITIETKPDIILSDSMNTLEKLAVLNSTDKSENSGHRGSIVSRTSEASPSRLNSARAIKRQSLRSAQRRNSDAPSTLSDYLNNNESETKPKNELNLGNEPSELSTMRLREWYRKQIVTT